MTGGEGNGLADVGQVDPLVQVLRQIPADGCHEGIFAFSAELRAQLGEQERQKGAEAFIPRVQRLLRDLVEGDQQPPHGNGQGARKMNGQSDLVLRVEEKADVFVAARSVP